MIKKKYNTTPLYPHSERSPIEIREALPPPSFRIFQIIRLLVKTVFRIRFGRASEQEKGIAWRVFFESMAGMWVKVGQLVAMRTDLFGRDFTRELTQLQYKAPCFPYADVEQIIESELGNKMGLIFSEFNSTPIAAASLAQVHRATLASNGKIVAVKVQRPYAEEFLKKDLRIIKVLFSIIADLKSFKTLMLRDMYSELEATLTEEVDFRYEAINLRQAKLSFKKYKIYVPTVYKTYSSKKVVVMEFITGLTMSEYIAAKREDPANLNEWLKKNKIKPKRVGSTLLRNMWQQTFEDNYFHGDLQPGNIMLLAKSRIALIDLGSIGSIDYEALNYYRQQMTAIGQRDYSKAAEFALLASPNIPVEHLNAIKKSMMRGLKSSVQKSSLTDVDIDQKTTVHNASSEMTKELVNYGVSPNWSYLKLMRTFSTVDPSVVNLYPRIDVQKEWQKYRVKADARALENQINSLKDAQAAIADSMTLVTKWLRNEVIDFRSEVSRGVMVVAYIMNLFKWLLIAAIVLLITTFVYAYLCQHTDMMSNWCNNPDNWLTKLSAHIPDMPRLVWLLILAGAILFAVNFVHFIRRLKKPVRNIK
ncbi:ABC1 kinase family protein [Mucilaginibacter sp. X4EP1]|uniref:ABC1 kinase family protein n=1 Tax=Mucilaginibacter sp. X4EP1 TaxID=2723092 RepID=UPI00216A3C6F|nr:AarF/UbiB family protein [Mucilaginibacter sp. X4EP1]MCS3811913.1 ubiquinone biosynthesis protein [Mucilaginibacter sp. X4EP1]